MDFVNDKFLMENSTKLTEFLMKGGLTLDGICAFVKDYQRSYIAIYKVSPELAKQMDYMTWGKSRTTN